jgi:uncharacterized protein (DUF433 family)
MTVPEWLVQDPDGHIHLTGHRVSLEDIVHFYSQGDSPEMLHCRFPTVTLAVFYKAIGFYLDNKQEVDAYCAESAEIISKARALPQPGPTLEELRSRRDARRLA